MRLRFWVLIAALVALPAVAQPARIPVDPADGKAVSPALGYLFPFAAYRAWRDPEPMNWRRANDEAGAMGGHMGHLRGRASQEMNPGQVAAPPAKREPSK